MKNLTEKQIIEKATELTRNRNLTKQEIAVIILAIKEGYDTEPLLQKGLNFNSMLEILKGMKSGVNVSLYSNPLHSADKMKSIREWLEKGVDISSIIELNQSIGRLNLLASAIENGDLSFVEKYNKSEYSDSRLIILYEGYKLGFDITKYDDSESVSDEFAHIILHVMKEGIDVNRLVNDKYSIYQSRELLLAVNEGLDTEEMENPALSQMQMRQIRIGLAHNLNVKEYADPSLSVDKMKIKRLELMRDLENESSTRHKELIDSAFVYSDKLIDKL